MNAKSAVLLTALAALVGCTLTQSELRQDGPLAQIGSGGRLVTPKRCSLTVVIVSREQNDPILNDAVWRVADEQAVDPEVRRALQANGLRIGRIVGDLPPEVQELLRAKPPNQPDVQTIVNASGDSTLIDPTQTAPRPRMSLLLCHKDQKVGGKVYQDAKGYLRLTSSYAEGPTGLRLRIVPEIHHGPVSQGFGTVSNASLPAPHEFRITRGQQEETFRDLAATLTLEPGQVAVLGGRPERAGTLGDLLFQKPEGNSDRLLQSLVFVWANRADGGASSSRETPPLGLLPVDPADLPVGESASPAEPKAR